MLKARILVSRSDHRGALAYLNDDPPPSLDSTDVPFQRKLLQGIAHRYGQQYAEAEKDLAAAETIVGRLDSRSQCQLLIAKADLDADQEFFDEAETKYRKALTLARTEKNQILEANILGDLGRLAALRHRFDEAIDANQAALQAAEKLGMKGNSATITGNLASNYFQVGDFERALEQYKKGAEKSEQSGLSGYTAFWFAGAADSYNSLQDYASAESLATTTLGPARKLHDAETITLCLNTLAEAALKTNHLADAENYIGQALQMEAEGLDHFGTMRSLVLSGRVRTADGDLRGAEDQFLGALKEASTDAQNEWEAQAGLASVRELQGNSVEAESLYVDAVNTIEKARDSLTHEDLRLSFLSSGIAVYDDYIDFLVRHDRTADALGQAELSRARTLAEGLSSGGLPVAPRLAARVQPQQIARRLKSILLVYSLGEKQSHLWVATPANTTHLSLPGADQIDPLVKSYREAVAGSNDVAQSQRSLGEQLYTMLVGPAQKLIPENARVILLPDRSLYTFNFETLIVPTPQPHFWIEDVTLTTASSLTLLASGASHATPRDKSLFLVGDTVPPNADFPALPQAATEMRDVEKYFAAPHRVVLSGSGATPSAYLSAAPEKFYYMHFVTHGTASRTRPLESAVVLSKASNSDTFKLYARDILERRLSAYLVTISACNGAGTRAYSGEGLVGLSWAFLRAGAHNVIGALWEVSDNSTPELMDKLYDGLSQGEDPAASLRNAKLSLLHSGSVHRKPFYWAPFQLYTGS